MDDRNVFPCYPRSHNFYYGYERLGFVMRASGLNAPAFARRIGCDFNTLMEVRHRRKPLDAELVRQIHLHYPQIDPEWLLRGPAERL